MNTKATPASKPARPMTTTDATGAAGETKGAAKLAGARPKSQYGN
jgi:hypothetical protein